MKYNVVISLHGRKVYEGEADNVSSDCTKECLTMEITPILDWPAGTLSGENFTPGQVEAVIRTSASDARVTMLYCMAPAEWSMDMTRNFLRQKGLYKD